MEWGYLRETTELAQSESEKTGVKLSGLNEYLSVIFPDTEWIHDKAFGEHGGKKYKIRPDYRCEKLKLIVEFDGLPHYKNPETIERNMENQRTYESFGYKVVRIPYFIQLTNSVVKTLFDVDIPQPLFDGKKPSLSSNGQYSPAYLCPAGLKRMAKEFLKFPEQYETNLQALKSEKNPPLTGVEYLEEEVAKLISELDK